MPQSINGQKIKTTDVKPLSSSSGLRSDDAQYLNSTQYKMQLRTVDIHMKPQKALKTCIFRVFGYLLTMKSGMNVRNISTINRNKYTTADTKNSRPRFDVVYLGSEGSPIITNLYLLMSYQRLHIIYKN